MRSLRGDPRHRTGGVAARKRDPEPACGCKSVPVPSPPQHIARAGGTESKVQFLSAWATRART